MSTVKQSIGIDISMETFTACACFRDSNDALSFSEVKKFNNDQPGFNQLLRWVRSVSKPNVDLVFLMEATGVYYESLAHHLFKIKKKVVVVLPNKSKHYFSSLNVKTKTDEADAKVLSQFGIERPHRLWEPPNATLLQLRNLTRYYVQLQEQRTALGNIKHSKDSSHDVQQFIKTNNQKLIKNIDDSIKKIKLEIEKLINGNPDLKEKVEKVLTIKGIGILTVATIIAETLGFEHFNNSKQLISYAGYDIVQRESGTSIKGKTRISKKGNRYIRNALYFPGMVATRFNPEMKKNYLRIIQKKPSKMIGQVAIQRKLLILIYTLWKNNDIYRPENKVAPAKAEATQDSTVAVLL
jgi:transposase